MSLPQGRRRLVAAALLILSACATPEKEVDPLHPEKVVLKEGVKETPAAAEEPARAARAEADLASAEAALRAGDALSALAIANRSIVQGVPPLLEVRFRELRARARSQLVATKVCRVRIVPERDIAAAGRELPVRLEFANVSAATLQIPHALPNSSDATVIVHLVREDFDVFGNSRVNDFTLPVPLEEDLVIAPGGTSSTRLTIPPAMTLISHQGFSVMTLAGAFRPVVVRVGQSEFFDAIPIEAGKVRIFLAGYEQLTADPLASLKKAVAKRSPPHILTAAELVAPQDRAAAREVLSAAKETDPPLAVVLDASLARLASLDAPLKR